MADPIDNPILNAPYDPPTRHFEMGPSGPTGAISEGRRPSESFIPIAATRKTPWSEAQEMIDFDITGERRKRNDLINEFLSQSELSSPLLKLAFRGPQGHYLNLGGVGVIACGGDQRQTIIDFCPAVGEQADLVQTPALERSIIIRADTHKPCDWSVGGVAALDRHQFGQQF